MSAYGERRERAMAFYQRLGSSRPVHERAGAELVLPTEPHQLIFNAMDRPDANKV